MATTKKDNVAPKQIFWEGQCPDCLHCFAAHSEEGCETRRLFPEESASGVKRYDKCDCLNQLSALKEWQVASLQKVGIDAHPFRQSTSSVQTIRATTYLTERNHY